MGIRYFALKRLSLHQEGGPLVVEAGDLVPDGVFVDGSTSARAAVSAGEIAPIPGSVAALIEKPQRRAKANA